MASCFINIRTPGLPTLQALSAVGPKRVTPTLPAPSMLYPPALIVSGRFSGGVGVYPATPSTSRLRMETGPKMHSCQRLAE